MNRLALRFIASSACVSMISLAAGFSGASTDMPWSTASLTPTAFAAEKLPTPAIVTGNNTALNKINRSFAAQALTENAFINAQAAANVQNAAGVPTDPNALITDTGFRGIYTPKSAPDDAIVTGTYSGERSASVLSRSTADRLNLLNRQRVSQGEDLPLFSALRNSGIRFIHSTAASSRVIVGETELDPLSAFNTFLALKELHPYFARGDFYVTITPSGSISLSHVPYGDAYTLPLSEDAHAFVANFINGNDASESVILHFASDDNVYFLHDDNELVLPALSWSGLDRLLNPLFAYDDRDYAYTIGFRQHGVQLSFDGGEHTTILGSPLQILLGTDVLYFGLKDGRIFTKIGNESPVTYLDFARMKSLVDTLHHIVNEEFSTFSFQLQLPSLEVVSVSHPGVLPDTDLFASLGFNFIRRSRINLANTLNATPLASTGNLPNLTDSRKLNISLTRNGLGVEELDLGQGGFWSIANIPAFLTSLSSTIAPFSTEDNFFVADLESGAVVDPSVDRQVAHLYQGTLSDSYNTDSLVTPYFANMTYILAELPLITEFTSTAVERPRDNSFEIIQYDDLDSDDWVRPFLADLLRAHPTALRNEDAFDPARELTRAEAAKIILNVFDRDNIKVVEGEHYFMDTTLGSWQERVMVAARYHGLLTGEKQPIEGFMRIFMRPDEPVSRCEFMKIATNAMCTDKPENCLSEIDSIVVDDMSETNPFISYVRRGYDLGALNSENRTFQCDASISRREAVKVLSILGR